MSAQLNSNNNVPVLLSQAIFTGHWNCFLSSVARDGKDGHGLKLENIGPILLVCQKNYQNMSYKVWPLLSGEFFLISSP